MTITTKRIALALGAGIVALGVAAGVRASAQDTNQNPGSFRGQRMGPPPGPRGPGGPGGMMAGPEGPLGMLRMAGARLNLTDAQRDQLKAIADSHREEWTALRDRARAAHNALRDAVMADQIDEALIRSKAAEAAAVEADVAVAAARSKAEAWQVLTADQRAQLKQLQSDISAGRRPSFRGGRGRH